MIHRCKAHGIAMVLLCWCVEVRSWTLIADLEWELEAVDDEQTQTDSRLATLVLGIEAPVSDASGVIVTGLYEEDATDPELDVVVWHTAVLDQGQLWVGQDYLPFALFESTLIQDPLGFEVGETRARAIRLDSGGDDLRAQVYIASAESSHEPLAGGSIVWTGPSVSVRADVINDVIQSKTWLDYRRETTAWSDVPALALATRGSIADMTLTLGYLRSGSLPDGDVLETAQVELQWPMDALQLAVSWQYSANNAWLLQPRQRLAMGGRYAFSQQLELALELWRDEHRATTHGVTGLLIQCALHW